MSNKVDSIGRQLNIDDYVIFSGASTGISVGQIQNISKVKILIRGIDNSWTGGWHYPSDLFLISKSEVDNFHKHLWFYSNNNIDNFKNSLIMKDINEDELHVGQRVVCADPYGNLSIEVIKKFTATSMVLEGNGWYISRDKVSSRVLILK